MQEGVLEDVQDPDAAVGVLLEDHLQQIAALLP